MSETPTPAVETRVEQLRRQFDEAFALPLVQAEQDEIRYLAILVGAMRYAFRISDLAGVQAKRKVVPLPADHAALLGIAGVQGRLVPVFSLGRLLGHDPQEQGAWLALCGEPMIALAFGMLEGQFSAPHTDLHAPPQGAAHLAGTLRRHSGIYSVLDVPALLTQIRQETGG